MNRFCLCLCLCVAWGNFLPMFADPARVELHRDADRGLDSVRLMGSSKEDWWIEVSSDLLQWAQVSDGAPLVSGTGVTAPSREWVSPANVPRFYRARRTGGLYDAGIVREIRLRFDVADWQDRLIAAHGTTSNVPCRLEMDNGVVIERVGARYKGYSSFSGEVPKKSLNVQVNDVDETVELLGFETFNLNNAFGDPTVLREPIYFNVMQRYAPSPKGALASLFINGENWGVYSLAQQEDSDLIREWFPNASGDRWRSPNKTQSSSFNWLGSAVSAYTNAYELKKTADPARAWTRLVHAIDVLNNTPLEQRRETFDSVFALDSWLWFMAVEILFTDDDSYFNKGADFSFYYDAEAGRIHPVQHDGNEAFVLTNAELSPTFGEFDDSRPLLSKVLVVPELRQRYLAHLRTVLEESFEPSRLTPEIDRLSAISRDAIAADPRKTFTMAEYDAELSALKQFVTNRYSFLKAHPEVGPVGPLIGPVPEVGELESGQTDFLNVRVTGRAGGGVGGVWLWYRVGNSGSYTRLRMWDDGAHVDGAARDGVYGVQLVPQLAGAKVHYYVEARDATALGTATFEPPHAELRPKTYRVTAAPGGSSPVVINELMADNTQAILDPQGEADDWIELRNRTEAVVDLSGWYLSDEPGNPRKWRLPDGTRIEPNGYLLVWADEDGTAPSGLHASFKLSAAGETLTLVDTDARRNALRDSVVFGPLGENVAWGRRSSPPDDWGVVPPSPGQPNP